MAGIFNNKVTAPLCPYKKLIGSCKIDFLLGLFAAHNALACAAGLVKRNATSGRFGIFLYLCFAFFSSAPPRERPAILNDILQLIIRLWIKNVAVAEFGGALEKQ